LGLGQRLLQHAHDCAIELACTQLVLIAVQDALPYWRRHAFAPVPPNTPVLAKKLTGFGSQAHFMQKALRQIKSGD
jgi:hypothetical protein